MKQILLIIFAVSSCMLSTAFANDLDASPSLDTAQKIALDFAIDNIFSEILDHDSSVRIISTTQDDNRFTFKILADNCAVEVIVSKETGMAFNDDPMICNEQNQTAKNVAVPSDAYTIVSRKVNVQKAELVSVTHLHPKSDVLAGSKEFLIKVSYCGYDKVTSPRFQNLRVTSKKIANLGGVRSIYIEKSLELVVDVKKYKNVGSVDLCHKVSQSFSFICPIRPGFEGAGCQLTINGQYVIYIENFNNGYETMLGYSASLN